MSNKTKKIRKLLLKDEIKDLNEMDNDNSEYLEALNMLVDNADTKLPSVKLLRWQQRLSEQEDRLIDISNIISRIDYLNNKAASVSAPAEIEKCMQDIIDCVYVLSDTITYIDCYTDKDTNLPVDSINITNENSKAAINELTDFIAKIIGLFKISITQKDFDTILSYTLVYGLNITSNAKTCSNILKESKFSPLK